MPLSIGLLSVFALVLANGFFVATEFALVAVRRSRLDQLAADGARAAVVAQELKSQLDSYIAACQFGITMASLALGWIGEPAMAHVLEPALARVMGDAAVTASHSVAVGIAFALITALHIVIGELAPKGVALQSPERTTLWIARPMRLFYKCFRMPIRALNAVGNAALRLFGFHPASGHDMVHSPDELTLLVDASQEAGVVEESEAKIATRAFRFADVTAGELMTPRSHIVAVPIDAAASEVVARVRETGHTHILVYDRAPDDVVGSVHVRDLLSAVADGTAVTTASLVRRLPLVVSTRSADEVLEDMRGARTGTALVTDEYGATAGVITLHDLLEGLVGPIDLNVDREPDMATIGPEEADGSRRVSGLLRIVELEEITGIDVEASLQQSARTVAGLVMSLLGRMPAVGDSVRVEDWTLQVEDVRGQRVAQVTLKPPPPADPAPDAKA